jgi:hypothetical protein
MKPMKYKNSDLGMWHHFAEVAEQMKFVAKAQEDSLIGKCQFYSWDNEAFEEYCNCEKLEGKHKGFGTKRGHGGDFDSKLECWKCPFYSQQKEKIEK